MKKRLVSLLSSSRGFTLPELLASIAIMAIILTVVVYNHQKFDNRLELTNVAYRVAVSIREAQTYGVSVKELNGSFKIPYGVSFYNNNFRESSYVFFGDSNPNLGNYPNIYDGPIDTGCSEECIQRITLGRTNVIKKVCAYASSFSNEGACIPGGSTTGGPYTGIYSYSIVFKRPKSDAIITASRTFGSGPITGAEPLRDIFICLQAESSSGGPSPSDNNKAVHVSSAGQISVENVAYGLPSSVCL